MVAFKDGDIVQSLNNPKLLVRVIGPVPSAFSYSCFEGKVVRAGGRPIYRLKDIRPNWHTKSFQLYQEDFLMETLLTELDKLEKRYGKE